RYTLDSEGNKISNGVENLSEKMNYYHKPMFSVSDFWNVNEKLYISNIAYLSIGSGGGTGLENSTNTLPNGQVDFQTLYDANYNGNFNPDQISSSILRTAINNHFWFGLLSTFNYEFNDNFTFSGGIDARSYKGEHYREIYDLLGGKYFILDNENQNESTDKKKYVEDKIGYHNDGLVRWGGLFGQLEYKTGNFTAFVNLTASYCGYKRIDYFKPKVLNLNDTTLNISYNTSIEYNGVIYDRNSPGLEFSTTSWKWIPGGTIKGGVNYNLNENMNIFTNMGYISKAPRFNNVFDYSNTLFREIKNEEIMAFEVGYSYFNSRVTFNFNAYLTKWENKPSDGARTIMIDDEPYRVNINGMDALHKGVELEFAWKILDNLMFESLLSIGDWKWLSADSARLYDDNLNLKDVVYFDAAGIFVGDAAQLQNRESIRWEIIKDLYFKGAVTYFGKYYSEFDPLDLDPEKNDWAFNEDGSPKQSWKIPDIYLVDIHLGYGFDFRNVKFNFRASILNLLDETYISDADNNDKYSGQSFNGFDARSAAVFFGLGRRFNVSLQLSF
nr:TonB-dependent receptor [Bacteroidales bacterium]